MQSSEEHGTLSEEDLLPLIAITAAHVKWHFPRISSRSHHFTYCFITDSPLAAFTPRSIA
jgi:hypothetical protein